MIELADASRSRERSSLSANASFTSRWQSSKEPATARLDTLPPSVVISLRCGSLMRPSGKSTTTRNPGTPRNARATALPVSPEVATRTKVSPSARVAARGRAARLVLDRVPHEPRHEARADVLERERRTVEELERPHARRRSEPTGSGSRGSRPPALRRPPRGDLVAEEMHADRADHLGRRHAGQAREEARIERLEPLGHHSPPSGRGRRRALR